MKRTLNKASFDKLLREEKHKLIAVLFTQKDCDKTEKIRPKWEEFKTAKEYSNVIFEEVLVNDEEGLFRALNIPGTPSFLMFYKGNEVARIIGTEEEELEQALKEHAPKDFLGVGHQIGGGNKDNNDYFAFLLSQKPAPVVQEKPKVVAPVVQEKPTVAEPVFEEVKEVYYEEEEIEEVVEEKEPEERCPLLPDLDEGKMKIAQTLIDEGNTKKEAYDAAFMSDNLEEAEEHIQAWQESLEFIIDLGEWVYEARELLYQEFPTEEVYNIFMDTDDFDLEMAKEIIEKKRAERLASHPRKPKVIKKKILVKKERIVKKEVARKEKVAEQHEEEVTEQKQEEEDVPDNGLSTEKYEELFDELCIIGDYEEDLIKKVLDYYGANFDICQAETLLENAEKGEWDESLRYVKKSEKKVKPSQEDLRKQLIFSNIYGNQKPAQPTQSAYGRPFQFGDSRKMSEQERWEENEARKEAERIKAERIAEMKRQHEIKENIRLQRQQQKAETSNRIAKPSMTTKKSSKCKIVVHLNNDQRSIIMNSDQTVSDLFAMIPELAPISNSGCTIALKDPAKNAYVQYEKTTPISDLSSMPYFHLSVEI